jgi:hypothetical protein
MLNLLTSCSEKGFLLDLRNFSTPNHPCVYTVCGGWEGWNQYRDVSIIRFPDESFTEGTTYEQKENTILARKGSKLKPSHIAQTCLYYFIIARIEYYRHP